MSDGYQRRCGFRQAETGARVSHVDEHERNFESTRPVQSNQHDYFNYGKYQHLILSCFIWKQHHNKDLVIEPRAAAAVGQSGLMSLYDAMFSQYGVKIAQVLVTKPDFYNEDTRRHLASTISELISLNIVPIINTNDAVSPPPQADEDLAGVMLDTWLSK